MIPFCHYAVAGELWRTFRAGCWSRPKRGRKQNEHHSIPVSTSIQTGQKASRPDIMQHLHSPSWPNVFVLYGTIQLAHHSAGTKPRTWHCLVACVCYVNEYSGWYTSSTMLRLDHYKQNNDENHYHIDLCLYQNSEFQLSVNGRYS